MENKGKYTLWAKNSYSKKVREEANRLISILQDNAKNGKYTKTIKGDNNKFTKDVFNILKEAYTYFTISEKINKENINITINWN